MKQKLSRIQNKQLEKIEVFIAPKWMYPIYSEAHENGLNDLINRVMQNPDIRKIGKSAVNYARNLMKDGAPPDFPWSQSAAIKILNEAKEYIEKQVHASIEIFEAEKSSNVKAKAAIPRRPGINFIMK